MHLIKLSSKGQMVIPKVIREQLGIHPKKFIILEAVNDHAVIKPAPDVKKALKGILKRKSSLRKGLLEEHLAEVKRDETVSL